MEPKTMGWEAFVASWASRCNPKWMSECKQIILDLVKWIIPQVTNKLRLFLSIYIAI